MTKRIVFTGGTGKAGKHAVSYLLAKGYSVLNVDLKPLDMPGVNTLITDITDSGQVFNALTTHFGFSGFEDGAPPSAPDAVVHFAAVPRVLIEPDNKTFEANVMGTYNVLEAAMKLGVRKVVIASSETTYGVCFAEGDKNFHAFPLEEDYDSDPMDSYGLSKVVNEKTARAFAMRYGADVYALRIGNVTAELPTAEFLAKYCPDTPVWREMGRDEAPLSNRKAREVLGFREEHPWRRYMLR
ncbi:MAG: NAD(P)-dependent oxidoreductase [Rhizobiaceae bacterium]|nr:MAG: NAD(P)-dependent oxidoreductase [Rhizobiaceae bacterium]